eukprot:g4414.t1
METVELPTDDDPEVVKLSSDLTTLNDQIEICGDMMNALVDDGITTPPEVLLELIDFLDLSQERLRVLIQVGISSGGAASDEMLSRLVTSYDLVQQTLDHFDELEKCGFKSKKRASFSSMASSVAAANAADAAAERVESKSKTSPMKEKIIAAAENVAAQLNPETSVQIALSVAATSVADEVKINEKSEGVNNISPITATSNPPLRTEENTAPATNMSAAETTALFESEDNESGWELSSPPDPEEVVENDFEENDFGFGGVEDDIAHMRDEI